MKNPKFVGNTTRPGNPRWDEYVDDQTGASTLEEHNPVKTTFFEGCNDDHYFELLDPNGNIQCNKCQFTSRIVWGPAILRDGKIIEGKTLK